MKLETTKSRSYMMAKIKSKNTKPEVLVRKKLFSKGFRYSLHNKELIGKPDIRLTLLARRTKSLF